MTVTAYLGPLYRNEATIAHRSRMTISALLKALLILNVLPPRARDMALTPNRKIVFKESPGAGERGLIFFSNYN